MSVEDYKKAYPAALTVAKTEYADIRVAKDVANGAAAVAESVAAGTINKGDIKKMDAPQMAALEALGL